MVQSLLKGIGETETEQRCIILTAPTFTQVEWNFGPVTCRRLYLDGVDVPLSTDTGTLGLMDFDLDQVSVPKSVPKSVLEVVVDNNRLDILSQGTCLNIVQRKWDKCVLEFRPHFISFFLLLCPLTLMLRLFFWLALSVYISPSAQCPPCKRNYEGTMQVREASLPPQILELHGAELHTRLCDSF